MINWGKFISIFVILRRVFYIIVSFCQIKQCKINVLNKTLQQSSDIIKKELQSQIS